MRAPRTAASLAVTLALLGACEKDSPPPEADLPLPTIVGIDFTKAIYLPVGETLVLEATLVGPDGKPAANETSWMVNDPYQKVNGWTIEDPEPGRVRLRIEARQRADMAVTLTVWGREGGERTSFTTKILRIFVYGGAPAEIHPALPSLTLVPGERRAVGGVLLTTDSSGFTVGDGPDTWRTLDPSVASVDAHGVVTAVAPGQTSVVLSRGALASAPVPVVVAPGTFAPPAVDRATPLFPRPEAFTAPFVRLAPGSVTGALAVDARGFPHLAVHGVTPKDGNVKHAGVALFGAWTGTGYGVEVVSRPWEQVVPPIHLALDSRERLYLLYKDIRNFGWVLAERPLSGGPGDWAYRRLDLEHPELTARGFLDWETLLGTQAGMAALLPRAGGGVWAAYRLLHEPRMVEAYEGRDGASCAELIRLVEVTDTATLTRDAHEARWEIPFQQPDCEYHYLIQSLEQLALAEGEGEVPEVYALLPGDELGMARLSSSGGAWAVESLLPPKDEHLTTVGRTHQLGHLAVARAREPGQRPQFFGSYLITETPWDPPELLIVAPGTRQARWQLPASTSAIHSLLAFHAGPWTYQGGSNPFRLARLSPFAGALHHDELFAGVEGPLEDGEYFQLSAWADGPELVYVIGPGPGHQLYVVRKPRPPAYPTDDELTGRRLSDGRRTPQVVLPPLVRGDGRRFVLSEWILNAERDFDPEPQTAELVVGTLVSSAGPAQPWAEVARRVWDQSPDLSSIGRLWEGPGFLVGIHRPYGGAAPLPLARSTDGASWSAWGSLPSSARLLAELFTPEGQAFVLFEKGPTEYELWHAADLRAVPVWTSLGGRPAASLDPWDQLLTQPVDAALRRVGDEVHVLSTVHATATATRGILVQRFQRDGTPTGWWVAQPAAAQYEHWDVARGELLAGGDLVVPNRVAASGVPTRFLRVAAQTGTSEWSAAVGAHQGDVRMIRLADGRLVAAFTRLGADHRREAVYLTSADGLGWSEPKPLRPQGGRGQLLAGLAPEPGGGFLAVVGDNFALTPDVDADRLNEFSSDGKVVSELLWRPPVDYLLLRVPQP